MNKRDFKAGIEAAGRVIAEYQKLAKKNGSSASSCSPSPVSTCCGAVMVNGWCACCDRPSKPKENNEDKQGSEDLCPECGEELVQDIRVDKAGCQSEIGDPYCEECKYNEEIERLEEYDNSY